MNVASIKLSDFADRTKKYAQIDPTQYSYSKGVLTGSNDMREFDNGDYLTYSSINFGSSGTSTRILITYAKNNTGGKIEIRIGGPGGTLIGTFSPSDTGSWNDATKTDDVPINDVEGIHDVTFVGKDRN